MSVTTVKYDENDFFIVRALSYGKLGLHQHVQRHKANLSERIANAVISAFKYLPNYAWAAASELGLTTNAYLLFPFFFFNTGESGSSLFPTPSLIILQTAACAYSAMVALGYVLRAVGRYTNSELMADFYTPSLPAPIPLVVQKLVLAASDSH